MAILVHQGMKVMIQGITGKQGSFHTKLMQEYHMDVVAGVTPGKKGESVQGVPVFHTVAKAKSYTPIDASLILVPPAFVYEAAFEAISNAIPLIVICTEHVPVHDSIRIRKLALKNPSLRVIGPNTIGVISPGKGKVGIMPGFIYREGNIGIISRSGTLTHEIASNLTYQGLGQSTCLGIGGDPVMGTDFIEALKLFSQDNETEAVVLIGEIGGAAEEIGAQYLKDNGYPKPVLAYIAGKTAPREKKMGHAGAIIHGERGTAQSKMKALSQAGVTVASSPNKLLEHLLQL